MKTLSVFALLLALSATVSASKLTSGPAGQNSDTMVSEQVHKVPNPLERVVEEVTKNLTEVTKNLTELTKAYASLCQEVLHLSRHVIFHEHAFKHIAQAGHHHHGGHFESGGHDHHDHSHNRTDSENEISQSPVTTGVPQVLDETEAHHHHGHDHEEHHHHSHDHEEHHHHGHGHEAHHHRQEGSKGCGSDDGKKTCSILHEHTCHDRRDDYSTKPFNEQFNLWFQDLISHEHDNGVTEKIGTPVDVHVHHSENETESDHHHHHHHGHHSHNETLIGVHDHAKRENRFNMDDMEDSVREPEMIYATCEIIPNRHISLILQENVEGRINLWQQKDGHGPLFTHVKVSGLRVRGELKSRVVRESNVMPIETPLNEGVSQPQSVPSLERAFHVHVNGDLTRDCQSTGTHYNPTNSAHGGPMDNVRHVGDLGNIRSDERGAIDAEYTYPYVSLVGEHSIIGRSLVIHAQIDDLGRNGDESSITSGNSGAKIACCVIEEVQQLPSMPDSDSSIGAIQGVSRDPSSVERESVNN